MKIAVVGMGHVGLITAACFAEMGNDVTGFDLDAEKISRLSQGEVATTEPGLSDLALRNARDGRLAFTTELGPAVRPTKMVFLALTTPSGGDGLADLSSFWSVVDKLTELLPDDAIVVNKGTVAMGTNAAIYERLRQATDRECDVAVNPEFLREGAAIDDFMNPDRIVVGVRRLEVAAVLKSLYDPLLRTGRPFLIMSPESAEMTKLVANAYVSTKISFINEAASLCERMQADIDDVQCKRRSNSAALGG